MLRYLAVVLLLSFPYALSPALNAQSPPTPADPTETRGEEVPAPREWQGTWYSSFGFVDLAVDGNDVTGTYSCCGGTVEGTVQGTQIEFSWRDPIYGDGWGYWYWQDDGARLRGIFGKMEDMGVGGEWNAVRLPEPDLGDDPVRLAVRAEHPRHGTFRGEAVLSALEGDSIEGTLRGAYDLEARDKPFKYEMWNALSGRRDGDALVLEWLDPLHEILGDLRLTPSEGEWVGTWQPHFTDGDTERRQIRLLPPQG